MNSLPRLCFFGLGVLAGLCTPLLEAKEKGLDILISADAIPSPDGFRPKPGKPIYYLLFQSRETLGQAIGGVKLPQPAVVERAVVAELEKQGFVRTQEGGPIADIVIFAVLGDSNFKDEIPAGNPWNDGNLQGYLQAVDLRRVLVGLGFYKGGHLDPVGDYFHYGEEPLPKSGWEVREAIVNEARRLRNLDPTRKRHVIKTLVGAPKVERAMANRTLGSVEAERIAMATFDDQYYLSLSAVEAKKQPDGGRRFLWRTTMLIDWRTDFTQALPTMLTQAGPLFGTDVAVPGFINTARPREGKVEIGETKVVPDKGAAKAGDGKK